jgi:hypothetical protein
MRRLHLTCGVQSRDAGNATWAPRSISGGGAQGPLGVRLVSAHTAYCMRRPHPLCGARIRYAVSAYGMRFPHTVLGSCIRYAVPAYGMRFPHTVCGSRIRYWVPTYGMRVPHTVCGYRIQYAASKKDVQLRASQPNSTYVPPCHSREVARHTKSPVGKLSESIHG